MVFSLSDSDEWMQSLINTENDGAFLDTHFQKREAYYQLIAGNYTNSSYNRQNLILAFSREEILK